MATSSTVILLIVAGSFLGAAYGGDKLHVPPAQDISSFTFQLRTIYGNSTLSNGSLHTNMTGDGGEQEIQQLRDADDNLNIYALPVGQGDCTVIQCPRTEGDDHSVITIIDAGSSKKTGFYENDLIHFLRLHENSVKIKSIFLTHPDEDHINYIDAILNAYNHNGNVPVYHSCDWEPHYNNSVKSDRVEHKQVKKCCGQNCNQREHSVTLCTGVTLRVIGSEFSNKSCAEDPNGKSIVSIIEYGETKTLITGDFEGGIRFVNKFIKCAGNLLRANIYRLSHHGADNGKANRRNFLREINAEYVFSSSGFRYGHPRCKLYHYYQRNLEKEEEEHNYTCQRPVTGFRKLIRKLLKRSIYINETHKTNKAIYVTAVEDDENQVINYVIQFTITAPKEITPKAWHWTRP